MVTAADPSRASRAPAWAEGWSLVGVVFGGVALASLVILATYGATQQGLGLGARVTLRIGWVCFLLALVASSLPHFGLRPTFAWILRNRRYLGVSFAIAHLFHAGFVIALRETGAVEFDGPLWAEPGFYVYLWMAGMVLTSFDATARAIPRRLWVGYHRIGMYAIWVAFLGAFLGRALDGQLFYGLFTLATVGAMALRWWVTLARRRRRARVPAR